MQDQSDPHRRWAGLTPATPGTYAIRVVGQVDSRWSAWFGDMAVAHTASGETVLSGPVADQAALHGLLARVRDLNLVLIAVTRVGEARLTVRDVLAYE